MISPRLVIPLATLTMRVEQQWYGDGHGSGLTGGGVVQKHVLDVVVNHKYLVHTDATSVACVMAMTAAFPRDLFGEQMFEQGSLCFSGLNLCSFSNKSV